MTATATAAHPDLRLLQALDIVAALNALDVGQFSLGERPNQAGWYIHVHSYTPEPQIAEIREHPCRMFLRWTRNKRISVVGTYPALESTRTAADWGVVPYGTPPLSITVDRHRAADAIAKGIERRFLRRFAPLWVAAVARYTDALTRREAQAGLARRLARVGEITRPLDDRNLYREDWLYYDGGRFRVFRDGRVAIEPEHMTADQAVELIGLTLRHARAREGS